MGYFDAPFWRPLPFLLQFRLCSIDIDSSMSQWLTNSTKKARYHSSNPVPNWAICSVPLKTKLFLDVNKDQGLGDVRFFVVFPVVGRADEWGLVRVRSEKRRRARSPQSRVGTVIPKKEICSIREFYISIDASVIPYLNQCPCTHAILSEKKKINPTPWPGKPDMVRIQS